jgi:hypothetical protein
MITVDEWAMFILLKPAIISAIFISEQKNQVTLLCKGALVFTGVWKYHIIFSLLYRVYNRPPA